MIDKEEWKKYREVDNSISELKKFESSSKLAEYILLGVASANLKSIQVDGGIKNKYPSLDLDIREFEFSRNDWDKKVFDSRRELRVQKFMEWILSDPKSMFHNVDLWIMDFPKDKGVCATSDRSVSTLKRFFDTIDFRIYHTLPSKLKIGIYDVYVVKDGYMRGHGGIEYIPTWWIRYAYQSPEEQSVCNWNWDGVTYSTQCGHSIGSVLSGCGFCPWCGNKRRNTFK